MEVLHPQETVLIGEWIEGDGQVRADAICARIERLTNGILNIVQDHPLAGGWRRLFRDRADGRYWELFYPHSDLHGGGPPALRLIGADEIAAEYGFRV